MRISKKYMIVFLKLVFFFEFQEQFDATATQEYYQLTKVTFICYSKKLYGERKGHVVEFRMLNVNRNRFHKFKFMLTLHLFLVNFIFILPIYHFRWTGYNGTPTILLLLLLLLDIQAAIEVPNVRNLTGNSSRC